MQAGRMNTKIIIEQNTATRDSYGAMVESWSTYITTWADRVQQASREFYAINKVNSEVQALYRIRYQSGIDKTMRINDGGQYYNIIGIEDPGNAHKELLIAAKEVI